MHAEGYDFFSVNVPVALVDNASMPGPRCSLRRRSSLSLLTQCLPHHHCRCLRRPTAAASTVNVDVASVSAAAAAYQPSWSQPVAPQKSILVDILLNRKTILVRRHKSMVRRRDNLSAYLCCICANENSRAPTKSPKNQERTIRHCLKKYSYGFKCVSAYVYIF